MTLAVIRAAMPPGVLRPKVTLVRLGENTALARAAAAEATEARDDVRALISGSVMLASDGVQFDRAKGESFITRFTAPVDAALTVADGSITFNSVGAALNLPVKLKNFAGTGDFKGCFEDNWEIDSTTVLLAAPTAADQNLFRVGFADGVGRFYGARIQSHPGASTQLFAALEVAGNSVATIPSGYTYTVGDTIRVRTKRNGNFITITLNWNGGADIVLTSAAMVPVDASTVERPRLFSVPQVIYLRGNVRTDTIKISHGGANPKLAIAATSLGDGRFTATYGASYTQLIKSAHPGEVLVCAAPGATSAQWAAALPELLATGAAEILFEPFANDMATLVPLATTQANVASIVAQCEAVGVKARFLNCPPNNYFAGAINTWLATTALVWFDIFTILVAPGGGFTLNDAYESDTPIAGVTVTPDDLHWGTAGNLAVFTPVNAWLIGLGTFLRRQIRVSNDPAGDSAADVWSQSAVRDHVAAARGSGTSALGYGTGAGGTVTQATSKATGVTLSEYTGQITLNNAALAADTTVSFVLTNTTIAAGDLLILNHVSGGTAGAYTLNARPAAGSATIDVRNVTAGSLGEAIVIGYAVFRGQTT